MRVDDRRTHDRHGQGYTARARREGRTWRGGRAPGRGIAALLVGAPAAVAALTVPLWTLAHGCTDYYCDPGYEWEDPNDPDNTNCVKIKEEKKKPSCSPECGDRVCGPDPVCGQSCGECTPPDACTLDGTCAPGCAADCTGRACGPDPVCGQSCGECASPAACTPEGQCCTPDCSGRQCGPDPVCGVSCGTCEGAGPCPGACSVDGKCGDGAGECCTLDCDYSSGLGTSTVTLSCPGGTYTIDMQYESVTTSDNLSCSVEYNFECVAGVDCKAAGVPVLWCQWSTFNVCGQPISYVLCTSDFAPKVCDEGLDANDCSDGVKSGDETDVDCGGSCDAPCADGQKCKSDGDCSEDSECGEGTCKPEGACSDGVKNWGESDIDCGGSCPVPCSLGQQCSANSDCAAGLCKDGACTCSATGIDCSCDCVSCNIHAMCAAGCGTCETKCEKECQACGGLESFIDNCP